MPRILVPPFFGISTARTGPGKYDPDDMRFHSLYRLPRRSASNRSTFTPSAPAAPLFSFTFSHASHTSRFGISCVLPCNIGSVMWFIPSGWPHSSTRATRPLGSARITGSRSYYGPVRQRASRPVLSPSRFLPLGVLPLAATPGGSSEATPSHVPYESLVRAHAACTPDTAWAVNRYPPGSSQGNCPTLVPMSTELISTLQRAFSRAAHHAPPLKAAAHAGLIPPPARRYRRDRQPPSLVQHRSQRAHHRSPSPPPAFVFTRQSSANAADGGLKPPPEGRLRRAISPSSLVQHRVQSHCYLTRPPALVAHRLFSGKCSPFRVRGSSVPARGAGPVRIAAAAARLPRAFPDTPAPSYPGWSR